MSARGSITFDWADGEHTFRLAIGQLRELQDKCDAGPMQIYQRLMDSTWRVDDVRETLRLGLIGGGMKPMDALLLTRRYVDEQGHNLIENAKAAQNIVLAALVGVKDDPVGKGQAGESQTTGDSTSPPSTVQEPPLDGQQDRSTNSASGN
ncbi:MAG: hypothetical protein JWM36_4338 [Hyphomicrobiales bacterium]|nr:hypothetical protein [Hyphomicrobiales bacterium]